MTEQASKEMAADISEVAESLPDSNTIIVLHIFDNAIYYGCTEEGEVLIPKKGSDRKYHIVGNLHVVKKAAFRELFGHALNLIKSAGKKQVILMAPLPRYLFARCCNSSEHLWNREEGGFGRFLRSSLQEITTWMESMVEMRRMKNVSVFNTMEALGLLDEDLDEDRTLRLWGSDPVHPTEEAYQVIAEKVISAAISALAAARVKAAEAEAPQVVHPKKAARRDSWIGGAEPVAKRRPTTDTLAFAGPSSSLRGHGSFRGQQRGQGPFGKRPFRGRGWGGGRYRKN